ncbi:MAG: M28 family peptidase, partial [Bryobacteraceae bacterium]
MLGHTSEQGAQDNATGVSAMVEAVSTLSRLVGNGRLPRPRRSIRILLMPEMYGSLSYITAHAERMRRTVAAMTIDTPAASYDLSGTEYTFYMNPQVAMSYTDALALRIAEAYLSPHRPWHWNENTPGTDSYLGEPTVGAPDVWIYSGTGVVTHHNSEDKPDTVDPRSLHDLTTIIATYLYFNATAGEPQMPWLAQITLDHVFQEMTDTASSAIDGMLSGKEDAGAYGLAREAYFGDRGKEAVLSVLRLAPEERRQQLKATLANALRQVDEFRDFETTRLRAAGAQARPENYPPGAEKIVVRRKRIGTLPLDDLAQDRWEGFPSGAWAKRVIIALYWCDGKRNLAQVSHLTEMELGPSKF